MCWISDNLIMRIADKDFTVYKLLIKTVKYKFFIKRIKYYAPIHDDFEYKKGEKYSINHLYYKMKPFGNKFYMINEGFHSFVTKYILDEYLKRNHFNNYDFITPVQCIIPKGSEYCINANGEVVSNQIIFKKEIKL